MPITPISRSSAAAACADALRDDILRGALAAGGRLPPERQLADDFAVNRVTVRAALTTLVSEGLLAIRQGSGATVVDFKESGALSLLPAWIRLARGRDKTAAIADLLAVRRALARVLFDKLAGHALDDAALARVDAAVAVFAAVVEAGAEEGAVSHADMGVIRALLREAHSPVLSMCLNPIAAVLAALPDLRAAVYASPTDNLEGWRAVAAALRAARGVSGEPGVDVAVADVALLALAERDRDTLARLASTKRSTVGSTKGSMPSSTSTPRSPPRSTPRSTPTSTPRSRSTQKSMARSAIKKTPRSEA